MLPSWIPDAMLVEGVPPNPPETKTDGFRQHSFGAYRSRIEVRIGKGTSSGIDMHQSLNPLLLLLSFGSTKSFSLLHPQNLFSQIIRLLFGDDSLNFNVIHIGVQFAPYRILPHPWHCLLYTSFHAKINFSKVSSTLQRWIHRPSCYGASYGS